MDGIGKPKSYGKYEIFDDEHEALTWDAAEKKAHEHLRNMGVPVQQIHYPEPPQNTVDSPVVERVVHKSLEEATLPLPFVLPGPDHKLEAIARAHILLHFLKDTCCKEHPDHIKWIADILLTAPQNQEVQP